MPDGAGAGLGAADRGAADLDAAAFFGAALRVFAFLADFGAAARFVFLRAGAAFFALLAFFLVFDFAFFAFFAILDSRRCDEDLSSSSTLHAHIAVAISSAAAAILIPASAFGTGPPVAQSISSTVWTIGIAVPAAICTMQPAFPAAITSGLSFSILAILRSRNLPARSGCRMLYVPADPQHR